MAFVITLEDFTPSPREDNKPWNRARIEEGPTKDGPWTILTPIPVPLTPIDADPRNPAARDFTVNNAELEHGWYQVTFIDGDGNIQPVEPVENFIALSEDYTPTVSEIAALIRARTKDKFGDEIGTFNEETRPTFQDVRQIRDQAVQEIVADLDEDIPQDAWTFVQKLIALRTAMLIELSYWPEQTNTDRSAYINLKTLFDEQLIKTQNAVQREAIEEVEGEQAEVAVYYKFPRPVNWDTVTW